MQVTFTLRVGGDEYMAYAFRPVVDCLHFITPARPADGRACSSFVCEHNDIQIWWTRRRHMGKEVRGAWPPRLSCTRCGRETDEWLVWPVEWCRRW